MGVSSAALAVLSPDRRIRTAVWLVTDGHRGGQEVGLYPDGETPRHVVESIRCRRQGCGQRCGASRVVRVALATRDGSRATTGQWLDNKG